MRKLVIGASRALSAQPLGTLGEEHVFFDSHGLGKQANPVLHASHIRGTTAAAGCFVRPESGIECLTLVLHGALDVQDSAGHHAHLQAGDAEWSTAGHGTLHRYAGATDTPVEALSVWLNLPAAYKSTPPPTASPSGQRTSLPFPCRMMRDPHASSPANGRARSARPRPPPPCSAGTSTCGQGIRSTRPCHAGGMPVP